MPGSSRRREAQPLSLFSAVEPLGCRRHNGSDKSFLLAAALDNPDSSRPRDPAEATFNTLVLAAIALAAVALHLAYATGYGYFRDELCYLACANHRSFGYVDRPPLSIWLLYLQRSVLGDSLFTLSLLPAL